MWSGMEPPGTLSGKSLPIPVYKVRREQVEGQRYKKLFVALILGKDGPKSTTSNFGSWSKTGTLRNLNLLH